MIASKMEFPAFTGKRCLMMPYIQGDPDSVPPEYREGYEETLERLAIEQGRVGYLTIDESEVHEGKPHRGDRAKYSRALHTETGVTCGWGDRGGWGGRHNVLLDRDVRILIASNVTGSCAVWDTEELNTTIDGDIGHLAGKYPYESAKLLGSGEVANIGIFTPHESLPVRRRVNRQFIRIISNGVHGREPYFTKNRILD